MPPAISRARSGARAVKGPAKSASTLHPMREREYAEWLEEAIRGYAADKVEAGQWREDTSLELSRNEFHELLPQGLQTPDNHLYTIVGPELEAVGVLWFAVKAKFAARIAYVYDVSVRPDHRRHGHALRAFHALEEEARRLGLSGIALHVFGHNKGAQELYAKLGFQPTNISLYKPIAAQST